MTFANEPDVLNLDASLNAVLAFLGHVRVAQLERQTFFFFLFIKK